MEKKQFSSLSFCIFLLAVIIEPVRVYAFSHKIDSIQIVFDNQQLVLPGETFNIGDRKSVV